MSIDSFDTSNHSLDEVYGNSLTPGGKDTGYWPGVPSKAEEKSRSVAESFKIVTKDPVEAYMSTTTKYDEYYVEGEYTKEEINTIFKNIQTGREYRETELFTDKSVYFLKQFAGNQIHTGAFRGHIVPTWPEIYSSLMDVIHPQVIKCTMRKYAKSIDHYSLIEDIISKCAYKYLDFYMEDEGLYSAINWKNVVRGLNITISEQDPNYRTMSTIKITREDCFDTFKYFLKHKEIMGLTIEDFMSKVNEQLNTSYIPGGGLRESFMNLVLEEYGYTELTTLYDKIRNDASTADETLDIITKAVNKNVESKVTQKEIVDYITHIISKSGTSSIDFYNKVNKICQLKQFASIIPKMCFERILEPSEKDKNLFCKVFIDLCKNKNLIGITEVMKMCATVGWNEGCSLVIKNIDTDKFDWCSILSGEPTGHRVNFNNMKIVREVWPNTVINSKVV